jgi:hypothetical protein
MKSLKDHLKESRENPENIAPLLRGHRERFEEKLDKSKPSSVFSRQNPNWLFAAAASLLILISLFTWQWSQENTDPTLELSEASPVHAEMESYFRQKIDQKNTLFENNRDSVLIHYGFRLQELKTKYQRLETVHASHPGDQRVVQAMIDNYKAQLKILESLQRYIEMKKQIKSQNNEYNSI